LSLLISVMINRIKKLSFECAKLPSLINSAFQLRRKEFRKAEIRKNRELPVVHRQINI